MARFNPDWRVPPGEILKEWMAENGMIVRDVAEACNMQKSHVRDILTGTGRLTVAVAGRLEVGTGIKSQTWLNLEQAYRAPIHG